MDKAGTMVTGGVMLLILCVLPAGMSRSAWLAAGVSCLCVYAWHMDWTDKFRLLWQQQRQRVVMVVVGGFCVLLLAGYLLFVLKPDSARGRLFMWKITCRAIAEKPLTGYGIHNFAAAYGNAQETYFAAGDYEPWEERVAGSPEYAFNEYLQAAVELGIPLAVCLLVVVVLCLYRGVRKGRYGIWWGYSFFDDILFFLLSATTSGIYRYIWRIACGVLVRCRPLAMVGAGCISRHHWRFSPEE